MKQYTLNTDHPWLKVDPITLATYNSFDGVNTAALIPHIQRELESVDGNHAFFWEEVWPTIPALLDMMDLGIPIDVPERTRLRRSFRAEVRECDQFLCAQAGHPNRDMYDPAPNAKFNPNSDTQVRRWLFGGDRTRAEPGTEVEVAKGVLVKCLGLKPTIRTESGAWSVAQGALLSVLGPSNWRKRDEPARPILHAILHRSRFVKLDEYLDFEYEDRGLGTRIYPTIKPFGTKSLRLAYSDPPVQSWAKELRSMVRARPGHLLVGADYSQVEARIAAYLSGDEADIAIYERPERKYDPDGDIHTATVLEAFRMSREQWNAIPNKSPYRDWAKCLHPDTLIEMHDGTPKRACELVAGDHLSTGVVEQSWPVGEDNMIEVETYNGHKLIVTEDHPFQTQRGWVKAKDLVAANTKRTVGMSVDGLDIVMTPPRPTNPEIHLPDEVFSLLGYLVGDGNVTHGAVGFANLDEAVIKNFTRCVEALGGVVKSGTRECTWRAIGMGWFPEVFGIRRIKSIHKSIPAVVWNASDRQRELFLAAYFECDGHTAPSKMYFGTSSFMLARDIHLMLGQMNMTSILSRYRPENGRETYKVSLTAVSRARAHFWPFVEERKRPEIPQRPRRNQNFVLRITPIGRRLAWGVQVSSGVHVTNGVLTHNTFRYGCLLYGGEPETARQKTFCPCPKCMETLPDTLDLPKTKLRELTDAWFSRHPDFVDWRNKLLSAFGPAGTRSIKMASGWRSTFVNPWSSELRREAFNRPIQHTAAWIIMRAERRLHAIGCPLILQHHDALIAEVPENEVSDWKTKIKAAMENTIHLGSRDVRFPTECNYGESWHEI